MPVMSPFAKFNTAPAAAGLYDPARDRDACGLAMVATLRGKAGHDIIDTALNALRNLEHRGAVGSDAGTGDGAGDGSQAWAQQALHTPVPTYSHPKKKWRLKRAAVPNWYKQRSGVRTRAQSGAARVARFRPKADAR